MVAIDVRSLLKRAKAERGGTAVTISDSTTSDTLAAAALRLRSSQQVPLDLAKHTVTSDLQVFTSR